MRLFVRFLGFLLFASVYSIPQAHTHVLHHSNGLSDIDETHSFPLRSTSSFHQAVTNASAISRRAHNLQIHSMAIHSVAVPFVQAAASLTAFYSTIVRECISNWINITPMYTLRISNGYFCLILYGTGGPIPWTLVAEIAGNMVVITQLGFTGTYDIFYVNGGYMSGGGSPMGAGRSQRGRIGGEGVLVQFRIGLLEEGTGSVIIDVPVPF